MSSSTLYEAVAFDDVLIDTININYTSLNNIISNAIISGNVALVSSFVRNSTTIPFFVHKNKNFVDLAYSNKQLESAEVLISNGASFNVKSMFLINDFACNQIEHLNKIKPYISNTKFEAATNLVEAYGCKNKLGDAVILNRDLCINVTQYMNNHTVSNIDNKFLLQYYKDLQYSSNILIEEIMKGIVGTAYSRSKSFIIMPVGTRTYFESANIVIDNKPGFIYLPINNYDKTELSFTIHEFLHYLLRGLPEFNGMAYFNDNSKKEYIKAAKATLLNIFTTILKGTITANDYNELVNNTKYDVKFVGDAISNNSIINCFIYLNNPDDDLINEVLVNQYIGNTTLPALNRKIIYGHFLESIMEQNGISQDEGYMLARIAEFLKRSADEFDKELIVRMFELDIYGINNKNMKVFDPLYEYWSKYVSPKIQEVIKTLPIPFCDQIKTDEVLSLKKSLITEDQITEEPNNLTTSGNIIDFHQEL